MTEERISILGIPVVVQDEVCHIRRNSNVKIRSLNGGMKIHSRYLRPSFGSCHDFCKYGAEQALEIKAIGPDPMSKGFTEGHDLERMGTSAKRKKNLAVRLKSFPVSKAKKLDVPIVNGVVSSLTSEETVLSEQFSSPSEQVSSPLKEIDVSHGSDPQKKPELTKTSSFRMHRSSNGEGQGKVRIRKSKEMGNLSVKSPKFSSSRRESETKRTKVRSSVKGERKLLVPSSISQSPKHSLSRVSIQSAETSRNVEKVSHLRNQKKVRKPIPEQSSSLHVAERTLHSVLKPKSEAKNPTSIKNEIDVVDLPPSSSSSPEEKSYERARSGSHSAQLTTFSAKANLRHSDNKIHLIQSSSSYSYAPSPRKNNLRGTLLETSIAQPHTSSLASFSTHSGTPSEHCETSVENQTSNLKTEYNNNPRKGKTISLNYKCYPVKKLEFRRGKVVNLQPEVSAPRRLKFRQRGTMLGDSQNGKVDTSRKTVGKNEFDTERNLRRSQYGVQSLQSRLSWPAAPKRNGTLVSLSEHGETDTEKQVSDLEKEYKNTHTMAGKTSLKEEFDPGKKLADLPSEDTTRIPRKQKLVTTDKILDHNNQNGKVDVVRKNLGSKKVADNCESTVTTKESKKLVLGHHDVEEKNSGSLFNNVIEETVSKLVKSRKSKVKALVGAFETVISLQDTKPLVTATAS